MKRLPAAFALSTLVVLGLSGCQPDAGEVSGTVSYQRQPLTHGTVMFFCADQQIISRLINSDGTYSVTDLPLGPAKVAVVTHPPIPQGYARPQQLPPSEGAPSLGWKVPEQGAKYVKIPYKYSNPDQSGLAVTVSKGSQKFDIDLNPDSARR